MNFHAFLDELEKIAVTRSVQEWRKATAGGDTAGADAIARAHGALGAKPRYLEDISLGGTEAGVDKMMGSAGVPGAAAPNESGYIARKLYKPDSSVSRGEFTPRLLEQKQRLTDNARSLSPEAKAMVPAMYGHQTMGAGPTQRTVSHHEFVPGISPLGQNVGTEKAPEWTSTAEQMAHRDNVVKNVLHPMHMQGQTMADTISATGLNYGNVVNSPSGPKVLDFIPSIRGEKNPSTESFKKYVPTSGSAFDTGSLNDLRKEIYNPKMQIHPETADMQQRADVALSGRDAVHIRPPPNPNLPAQTVPATSTNLPTRPVPSSANLPTTPVGHAPTSGPVSSPLSHAPTTPVNAGAFGHAPTTPSVQGAFAHASMPSAVTATKPMASAANVASHLPTVRPGAIAGAAGRLENAAMKTAPSFLRKATTAVSHL